MAGSQGLLVGILLLGTAALTSVAAAETVPLPTPAPLPKEGAAPPAARPSANEQSGLGGIAAGLKSLFHLDKQPEAPAAPAPTTAVALNPTQRTQIDKVSAYLSGVQQLVGNFVQVGPDGSRGASPVSSRTASSHSLTSAASNGRGSIRHSGRHSTATWLSAAARSAAARASTSIAAGTPASRAR